MNYTVLYRTTEDSQWRSGEAADSIGDAWTMAQGYLDRGAFDACVIDDTGKLRLDESSPFGADSEELEDVTAPPATLNGYEVLRYESIGRGMYHVLVDRKLGIHRYVVATWWPDLRNAWSWGHYIDRLVEAHDFFALKVAEKEAR